MNKILKFTEYKDWNLIAFEFVEQIHLSQIKESDKINTDDDTILRMCDDIGKKFGFNLSLALTFGTGVKLFYPVVSKFVENLQLEIKPTAEDIVLLCITVISIIYLRYKKEPPLSEEDIKNKLNPEIQMKFGNPRKLVESLVSSFKHIYQFIKKFPKLFGVALDNIFDMFTYTSILIPVMNAISIFCDKYDLTPDNLVGNLASLGVGISTIASKRLVQFISNKIGSDKNKQIDNEEPTMMTNIDDLEEIDLGKSKLIKEQ